MTESPGFKTWPKCVLVCIVLSFIPNSEARTTHTSAKTCRVDNDPCPGKIFLSLSIIGSISITMYSTNCFGLHMLLNGYRQNVVLFTSATITNVGHDCIRGLTSYLLCADVGSIKCILFVTL